MILRPPISPRTATLCPYTTLFRSLGYAGGAMLFGSLLLLVALAYFRTSISRTVLFWTAFVLTRPLGAVVGDFLDKPLQHGGLGLSRYAASAVLLALVVMLVLALPQRPARRARSEEHTSELQSLMRISY